MRTYMIYYKDGRNEEVEVAGRKELIDDVFNGSEDQLKEEVELLKWRTSHMTFTEDPQTGESASDINTADANPYGWRKEMMNSDNPNPHDENGTS